VRRLVACVVALSVGTACAAPTEYALAPPLHPQQYELGRQKDWICREDETRRDVRDAGIVLTVIGAAAAVGGGVWLVERSANDRPARGGPVALTAGGMGILGAGVALLLDAGSRSKKIELARMDYAAALEDADPKPLSSSQCSRVATAASTAEAEATKAAKAAEASVAIADAAAKRAAQSEAKATAAAKKVEEAAQRVAEADKAAADKTAADQAATDKASADKVPTPK
jgi:hypothetical protein